MEEASPIPASAAATPVNAVQAAPPPATLPATSTPAVPVLPTPAPVVPVLPTPTPLPPETVTTVDGTPLAFQEGIPVAIDSPGRLWTSIEFLVWFTDPAPLSYPLVTSASLATPLAAFYFDTNDLNYNNYTGARLTQGYWLDALETWGVEGSAFFVQSQDVDFFATSTQTSVPPLPLALPFIDAASGTASALFISQIGTDNGSVVVAAHSRLWGAEANLVRTLHRSDVFRCECLAGFRYLDLQEDLHTVALTQGINNGSLNFLGFPIPASSGLVISDSFACRNQFAGAQVGSRVECRLDTLVFTLTGKLAVGSTHEVREISGFTSLVGPGATTVPGGMFSQPSNIGQVSRDALSIIPQVGFALGYQPGKHCRIFAGYDFLYWSNVVRPGKQIDANVNTSQAAWSSNFVPGSGASNPVPLFVQSGFWIQGVNIGIEFRY